MKLGIITHKKFFDCDETYIEYEEFEIDHFYWDKNHILNYVIKGSNHFRKLEENEEIAKLY